MDDVSSKNVEDMSGGTRLGVFNQNKIENIFHVF